MSCPWDVLIRNTNVIDGTGKAAFKGDVAIKHDRIVTVGKVEGNGAKEIDGSGLVTCPGFIDMHSHADLTILKYPLAENLVMQGITTFVGGNCGLTMAPLKGFLHMESTFSLARWYKVLPDAYRPPALLPLAKCRSRLEEEVGFAIDWRTFQEFLLRVEATHPSVNYVPLVGHNAIRLAVMGEGCKRRANQNEIEQMGVTLPRSSAGASPRHRREGRTPSQPAGR